MRFHNYLLLLLFFFLSIASAPAKEIDGDEAVKNFICDVTHNLTNDFVGNADRIDSLKATLSDSEVERYQYYFDYSRAYLSRMKGDLGLAFFLAERALEHFIYDNEVEWACLCWIEIARVAEYKQLIPEAVTTYKRVIDKSKDPRTLSVSYFAIARLRKLIGLDWKDSLALAIQYGNQTNDYNYILFSKIKVYYLLPESPSIATEIPLIADELHSLKCFVKEGDANKCLAFHYLSKLDYDSALFYVNKSLESYSVGDRPLQSLLGSAHYLKAKIALLLEDEELAYHHFNIANDIYIDLRNNAGNYSLYNSIYSHEYKMGRFESACSYLEKANECYKKLVNHQLEYYGKILSVFKEVELIEEELHEIHKKATTRVVVISLFLIIAFTLIILWQLSLKRYFERRSVEMEGKNLKLKEETGELLLKSSQSTLVSKVAESQNNVERKLTKYLSDNEILPDVVASKYADTMLCFDFKLPMLSDTEKRYAVMIALDVPIKVIAELLNVKSETVAQYRNRLRKKLGIVNTKIDLSLHLKTFLEDDDM